MSAPSSQHASRIAVVCEGDPSDPDEWSGTPFGLVTGLRSCGVEVLTVRGAPHGLAAKVGRGAVAALRLRPSGLSPKSLLDAGRRARRGAVYTARYGSLGTLYARSGLQRHRAVDAVVQIGSSYVVNHPRRVTFEDMTVRQAVRFGQYHWATLTDREIQTRVARQRSAYRTAHAVLTATPWTATSVVEDYGVDPANVIPVGLGRNHDAPSTYDKNWSTPRYLFVGRDWDRKNGEAVLTAFQEVREVCPGATLDLVGAHPPISVEGVRGHGPLALSDAIASARLDELFRASTCLVVPSRFEAAGIVYVEAAAAGMATIGTTLGGAKDMIGPGGVVVDPFNPSALREAMLAMADGDAARRYAEAGRARAEEFTWTRVAARVLHALGMGPSIGPVPW